MSTQATQKIMDYLARRDHSVKELREKLSEKFSREEVEAALKCAEENQWIPDPSELSSKVAQRMHEKKKGFQLIQLYLAEKGLPPIERDEELELQKAEALISQPSCKKWPYEKKFRKLNSRGFDHETIELVLKNITQASPGEDSNQQSDW